MSSGGQASLFWNIDLSVWVYRWYNGAVTRRTAGDACHMTCDFAEPVLLLKTLCCFFLDDSSLRDAM